MACVYILSSPRLDRFYVGSCEELSSRLEQHLNKTFGKSFTVRAEDWQVFLVIEDLQYRQARLVEQHIKQMKSSAYIRNLLRYPEMVAKLTERFK